MLGWTRLVFTFAVRIVKQFSFQSTPETTERLSSFFLSLRISTDIRLMAMSRAASFDGQLALLIACHLCLLFLLIIAVF